MFDRTKYLNEGAEAGLDGEPRENCPYALNSLECELWMDGCDVQTTMRPSR
jgi:ribosome modulation factor